MKRRAIAAAGAATLGAATAVVALVAGTTVSFAETTTSSAYGIAAEGALPFDPTPYVESTDGTAQTNSLLELPEAAEALLGLGVAEVSADDDKASVKLVDLSLLPLPELPAELEAALKQLSDALKPVCEAPVPELPDIPELPDNPLSDLLDELGNQLDPGKLCDALENPPSSVLELGLVEVYCEGDEGGVKLADVTILGQELPIPEAPEDLPEFPENPLLSLAVNKQVQGDDGSFSVTGLEVNIGDGAQVLSIGNATCGVSDDDDDDDDDDDPTATKPAPVTTGLPVTG